MKIKKTTFLSILLIGVTVFSGCSANNTLMDAAFGFVSEPEKAAESTSAPPNTAQFADGALRIAYLDVGQGDSTFIILPTGETMLIDAGEQSSSGAVKRNGNLQVGKKPIVYAVLQHQ